MIQLVFNSDFSDQKTKTAYLPVGRGFIPVLPKSHYLSLPISSSAQAIFFIRVLQFPQ